MLQTFKQKKRTYAYCHEALLVKAALYKRKADIWSQVIHIATTLFDELDIRLGDRVALSVFSDDRHKLVLKKSPDKEGYCFTKVCGSFYSFAYAPLLTLDESPSCYGMHPVYHEMTPQGLFIDLKRKLNV